jgi:hypothetical protein
MKPSVCVNTTPLWPLAKRYETLCGMNILIDQSLTVNNILILVGSARAMLELQLPYRCS